MNPQVYKDIKRIAKELPKFQKKNPDGTLMFKIQSERLLGKDLPNEFKKNNDWSPMEYYERKIKVPVFLNHEVNLIECYKKHGKDGINGYVESINGIIKSVNNRIEEPKLNFIQRLWKNLFNNSEKPKSKK